MMQEQRMSEMRRGLVGLGVLLLLNFPLSGCHQTYPADRVKESIQEICKKEYSVENVQVKIAASTIGVYIPMKKLFDTDIKEALASGKVAQMENLFQPSPEALDQVEDVLFSTSRVLLSTDLKLQFYVLQATDVEQTGLQLIVTGNVNDIRRVRLWDISRDEYRKRLMHELKLNRAVIWNRPVRSYFQDLEKDPSLKTTEQYFSGAVTPELIQSLFFFNPDLITEKQIYWEIGELKSTILESNRVLVYAPVTIDYDPKTVPQGAIRVPPGTKLEYFFVVSFVSEPAKILRVIPLYFLDEGGTLQKIPLPSDLNVEEDLKSWEVEFPLTEIHLGDFLAEQLSRRAQSFLFADERIQNTFDVIHLAFRYHREAAKDPYFSLDLDVKLKTPTPAAPAPTVSNEDVLYLLELTFREFVDVLRSYHFADYKFLELNLASDPVHPMLAPQALEIFRKNKTDLRGLLSGVSPF